MVNFLVLDSPSAYNIILGWPVLNTLSGVLSTYHLILHYHFSTPSRIGEIQGDQVATRECYVASMRARKPQEALQVEVLNSRDDSPVERGEPVEELELVILNESFLDRRIYIGSLLLKDRGRHLVDFLRKNINVFT